MRGDQGERGWNGIVSSFSRGVSIYWKFCIAFLSGFCILYFIEKGKKTSVRIQIGVQIYNDSHAHFLRRENVRFISSKIKIIIEKVAWDVQIWEMREIMPSLKVRVILWRIGITSLLRVLASYNSPKDPRVCSYLLWLGHERDICASSLRH